MALQKSIFDKYPHIPWGNLDIIEDEKVVDKYGLGYALKEAKMSSVRRPSSGRTSSIQKREGRKGRQAHYTRKAILEREKEADRRAMWRNLHPDGSERNWLQREEKRKTRKAAERAARKARKNAERR